MTRPSIDFGQTADDYGRHRPGFPPRFFERVRQAGIGVAGQRVLDLGCGTGTLARGFAARGCHVVGLDPSPEMLAQAVALSRAEGVRADYVRAWAEATGLAAGVFEVVCAGQCWHWFDRARAAAEVRRLLCPGGHALLAYFTYLSDPGTLGHATEALLLRYNPGWPAAGSDGRFPFFRRELAAAGLTHVDTFEFETDVVMTHEAWRGRLRACNGVLLLPPDTVPRFDADLAALLARSFPEPLHVPHRTFGLVALRP